MGYWPKEGRWFGGRRRLRGRRQRDGADRTPQSVPGARGEVFGIKTREAVQALSVTFSCFCLPERTVTNGPLASSVHSAACASVRHKPREPRGRRTQRGLRKESFRRVGSRGTASSSGAEVSLSSSSTSAPSRCRGERSSDIGLARLIIYIDLVQEKVWRGLESTTLSGGGRRCQLEAQAGAS